MAKVKQKLGEVEHGDYGTWWPFLGPRGGMTHSGVVWRGPGNRIYLSLNGPHQTRERYLVTTGGLGPFDTEEDAQVAVKKYLDRLNDIDV
jgi:hypothetical protein